MTLIHPDWPEIPDDVTGWTWHNFEGALYDLREALDTEALEAVPFNTGSEKLSITDIATIEKYSLSYGGGPENPKDGSGTDLSLTILGTLKDGRWFTIEAWNDYTGWGCRDGSEVRTAKTREQAINYGLTKEGRETLGLGEVTE